MFWEYTAIVGDKKQMVLSVSMILQFWLFPRYSLLRCANA